MTPYADFTWFGLLLFPVLATILAGFVVKLGWRWTLFWTAVVLCVQYGGFLKIREGFAVREIWMVAGFAAYQWTLAVGFLRLRSAGSSRLPIALAITLAILPLAAAKFLPLISVGSLFGFLGISYVTFRTLDVLFCINDRLITNLPALPFLGYLLFFAPISSGPIDRYRRFASDWQRTRNRQEFRKDLDGAVHRIFTGFLYKFILAALIKSHWLDRMEAAPGWLALVSFTYAYSLYLFFDFAGYSAFAIALSYLFGIHTPENFNKPFLSRNIKDFWNRWHISLSWWFRDHVYMRFVLAAAKGGWCKNKHLASYLGFFLSFGLMGLWHGTALHYILYGFYHAVLLVSYDLFARWNKRRKIWGQGFLWSVAGTIMTFHAVCFGFLLFSGHLFPAGRTQDTSGAAKVSAILIAEPNPLPAGLGLGKTAMTWDTGDGSWGQVVFVGPGGRERPFSAGARGTKEVPWIAQGGTYQFRLYSGKANKPLLASLAITRPAAAFIAAVPNPVPAGIGLGKTNVSWDTGDSSWGQVMFYEPENGERSFATGPRGSQTIDWIVTGGRYELRLYTGKNREKLLSSVIVSRPRTAFIQAEPNPVPPGADVGVTTIQWDAGDNPWAQVFYNNPGKGEKSFAAGPRGSKEVPWIATGGRYEFRLYAGSDHQNLLGSVVITRPQRAFIRAQSNPVPPGTGNAVTTIQWDTGDGSWGQVFLAERGKPEKIFSAGPKGSQEVPWIATGVTCEFRLYAGKDRRQLLGSVTVSRAKQ